ncbi:uncharacterized protein LOC111697043 [Eurytemora carolleeae]|uniref:uncharacterized protein LOC111697043 n=1 Tax=Eurytemora carolleeae TaxID=1294199 RepID=UPI000C77D147|nr:uncharacterized protein LOC111697043 [Eurytemora carolleeae]|eukprot:XP_023322680.1 uncharacterized protein LOC111697043 [Eurytemora affinis]
MQISGSLAGETIGGTSGITGDLNVSTIPPPPSSSTLIQLCRLWTSIHKSPPPNSLCGGNMSDFSFLVPPHLYDDRVIHKYELRNSASEGRMVGIDVMDNTHFTGRSLSLIGVLGGVLLILVMIACVTFFRHRKRVREMDTEGLNFDLFSSQLRQLNQARSSSHIRRILNSFPEVGTPAPPPDYDTVLKDQEKEEDLHLPSYSEAVLGAKEVTEVPVLETVEDESKPNPV